MPLMSINIFVKKNASRVLTEEGSVDYKVHNYSSCLHLNMNINLSYNKLINLKIS